MLRAVISFVVFLLASNLFAQNNLFRGESFSGNSGSSVQYGSQKKATSAKTSNQNNTEYYFKSSKDGSVAKLSIESLGCSVTTPTGVIFTTIQQPRYEGNKTIWSYSTTIGFTKCQNGAIIDNNGSSLRVYQTGFASFDIFYDQPISQALYNEISQNVKKFISSANRGTTSSSFNHSSSSSTKSNKQGTGKTRRTCPTCNGKGYQSTAYEYAAASTHGAMPPYHNYSGTTCPHCNSKTDHYHYPCTTCWGHKIVSD